MRCAPQSLAAPRWSGRPWELRRGVVLAAVGGYLDTLGFIMLDGLFVNHVTGNIILAAAQPGLDSLPEMVMFPVFFVATVAGTVLAGKVERQRPALGIPAALVAEAVILAFFLVLGVILFPTPGASGLLAQVAVGAVGVSAMAIQTVTTRLAGHLYPTNMVTGTMTVLGMDVGALVARLHSGGTDRAVTAARARQYAVVVLGFAAGAVVAAALTSLIHFWAAAVPLATMVWAARRELASRQGVSTGRDTQASAPDRTSPPWGNSTATILAAQTGIVSIAFRSGTREASGGGRHGGCPSSLA